MLIRNDMSLRGRHLIDRFKRSVSSRLALPVPPYGSPSYWDGVYSKLGVDDVYEWGNIDFQRDLKDFHYFLRKDHLDMIQNVYGPKVVLPYREMVMNEEEKAGGFQESSGVTYPPSVNREDKMQIASSVLMLGCGNSRLGEDILTHYIDVQKSMNEYREKQDIIMGSFHIPKIIQCDVSPHVVNTMTQRCQAFIDSKQMSIVQDDATQLTLIENGSIDAVVDKGLMDALFCANQFEQMQQVMASVHRALDVGKVFLFFSFSRPEFLMQAAASTANITKSTSNIDDVSDAGMWSHVEVRELDRILMYRFIKAGGTFDVAPLSDDSENTKMSKTKTILSLKRQRRKKRRSKKRQ